MSQKPEVRVRLTYKAAHHVKRLNHTVHSNSHFHTWTTTLQLAGEVDGHAIQEWMHQQAPYFGDHGDKSVEDVVLWWLDLAQTHLNTDRSELTAVEVMRDDGIGAVLRKPAS